MIDEAEAEAEARRDLAAVCRWMVRLGYDEAVSNHVSMAIEARPGAFLLNRWGPHFAEMRASDFMVVADGGGTVEGEGWIEPSAMSIHCMIHERAPHARCVLHAHPPYTTALSAVQNGRLQMAHQSATRFFGRIAYDDAFGGLAHERSEGERIADALGSHPIVLLANHGVVVTAENVAVALDDLFLLERACQVQILAMGSGQPLKLIPDAIAREAAVQWRDDATMMGDHLKSVRRMLDESQPGYRD